MAGTVIEFIIVLVAHAVAGICSSALKYSKKRVSTIWGIWIVIQCVILYYTEFVLKNEAAQFFTGFLLPLFGQYVIFFATTKGKLGQRIFIMLTYTVFFCILKSLAVMVKGTFPDMHPAVPVLIDTGMLIAVISYLLYYVCPMCRTAAKSISAAWIPLIFANITFLTTVILCSVFPTRLETFYDPAFIRFAFISILIMAMYPVIFLYINSMSEVAEKREIERQNELLLVQIGTEDAQLAADSQARHDQRHHNLVLLEFANNNDIESVREYLEKLVDSESQVWNQAKYCENMAINTVLTVYERRANENGICVKISAKAGRDVEISPQDLVIVIANLFENAIHAVQKLKNNDKPIDVSIKERAQRLLIKVENPCKNHLTFDEDHYGIGIRSVIATTNKYDGMYDFAAEDGTFSAKVSLNLQ